MRRAAQPTCGAVPILSLAPTLPPRKHTKALETKPPLPRSHSQETVPPFLPVPLLPSPPQTSRQMRRRLRWNPQEQGSIIRTHQQHFRAPCKTEARSTRQEHSQADTPTARAQTRALNRFHTTQAKANGRTSGTK